MGKIRCDIVNGIKERSIGSAIVLRILHFQIEVDGGINRETLATVLDAGADMIVAGSAIFGSNITDNVQYFQKVMDNEE